LLLVSTQRSRIVVPRILFLAILCSFLFQASCISPKKTPNLARVFADVRAKTGKRPVIVIPGILGSQLINSKTGEQDWPAVFRSNDDGSSLPMSPDLTANRDDLVAGKIVDTLRLGKILPEVHVYRDLLQTLRDFAGYTEGDWNNPAVHGDRDTYYVFSYDWRRDNVESARELARRISALKTKLNRPDLQFNIVAHSMGGLIARYTAMYGDADLPPAGSTVQPTWAGAAHIAKIVMIGVPNEGSADAFATLLYGYSITEGLRRRVPLLNKLTAEDAITSPALFQLLPHPTATRFLDEELKPVPVDLYDPEVWKRFGWSVLIDSDYRKRYASGQVGSVNGRTPEERLTNLDLYFAAVLLRAKAFHQALDVIETTLPPVSLLAIGGDCEETLTAPVLLKDKHGRWITLIRPKEYKTLSGKRMSKREVTEAMYAPGDGRVTRRSLLGEDLPLSQDYPMEFREFRSPLAISHAVFICDLHGQLQRNPVLQDNALTALVNEVVR